MATLTHTLDNDSPNLAQGTLTGTFDTAATAPTIDQLVLMNSTGYIKAFCWSCEDGIGVLRAERNVNSAGTATNGTVRIESNDAAARTYHFIAHICGM